MLAIFSPSLKESFIQQQIRHLGDCVVMTHDRERALKGDSCYVFGAGSFKFAAKFLKDHGVNRVLCNYGDASYGIVKRIKRDLPGVRIWVHFHGYDASVKLSEWGERYKEMSELVEGFIVPSQDMKDRLGEGIVVPYGVEIPSKVVRGRSSFDFTYVGREVEKKGIPYLLEAFQKVRDVYPWATMEIAGFEGKRVEGVKYWGEVSHSRALEIIRAANVYVQHSVVGGNGDMEGLPVAILEAMAAGVPVVSTRHGGIVEAVEEGMLCEERDVEGMAHKMLACYLNKDVAAVNGEFNRAKAIRVYGLGAWKKRMGEVLR